MTNENVSHLGVHGVAPPPPSCPTRCNSCRSASHARAASWQAPAARAKSSNTARLP
jgi:hypothetical protein